MASVTPFEPLIYRRRRTIGVVAERAIDLSVRDIAYGPRDWLCEHIIELGEFVGGLDVLEQLHAEPLPDEPFDWGAAGLAHRGLVAQILELADAACDELFDAEIRTVARRVLARAVRAGSPKLHDDADPVRLAAALVWVAAKGNVRLGRAAGLYAKQLWAHFGVPDCGEIGRALLRAAVPDASRRAPYWIGSRVEWLGDVALLTGAMRAAVLTHLDELLDTAAQEAGERLALRPYGGSGDGWERVRALRYSVRQVVKAADEARRAYVVIQFGELAPARVVALRRSDALRLRDLLDAALDLPRDDDPYGEWGLA